MRLWGFVLVLFLASVAGVLMSRDPGYTLFSYGNTTIEMPLWLSFILIFGLIAVLTFCFLLLTSLFNSSPKLRRWWLKRRKETARLQTYKGLLELAEGHWQKAERYLIRSALLSDTPLINYLSAAKAAEESGSPERRNTYLQLAYDASSDSEVAVRLTQAQLQFKHGELERSVENLERLYQETPKHPKVLRLLSTLYQAQNNWQALHDLLPILRKRMIGSAKELDRLEEKIYSALFPLYTSKGLKPLIQFWHHAPKAVKLNPKFVAQYATALYSLSAHEQAEDILEATLKKIWNDALIRIYGMVQGRYPKLQLAFAEKFLPTHFDNPNLLQCVGRLCLRNQLWGKARDYLEQSLSIKPDPETYAVLGQLMDHLGMTDKRDDYFKTGLLLATSSPVLALKETGTPLLGQNLLEHQK
jgi:HemY protein